MKPYPIRPLVEFIEACNKAAIENKTPLPTDAEIVATVAFVFLSPGQLFRCWLRSIRHSINYKRFEMSIRKK